MTQLRQGSMRLFQVAGIEVFLHWSWFVVALIAISQRRHHYSSLVWNVAEYVALFGIVLLHEFGHALACRQVGGKANRIVLWPLGGVAYVEPPPRPGATLWAIAAGPLVNLILLPIAAILALSGHWLGWADSAPDVQRFLWTLAYINLALLIFNLLPVYPLDGGQILRSLLWFIVGRARSLLLATAIGLIGALGLFAFALFAQSIWIAIMAAFIAMTCWRSWKHARILARVEQMPRRPDFACPNCRTSPPAGPFWICQQCGTQFDTFATGAVCPRCQASFSVTTCVHCGAARPISEWRTWAGAPPPLRQ